MRCHSPSSSSITPIGVLGADRDHVGGQPALHRRQQKRDPDHIGDEARKGEQERAERGHDGAGPGRDVGLIALLQARHHARKKAAAEP